MILHPERVLGLRGPGYTKLIVDSLEVFMQIYEITEAELLAAGSSVVGQPMLLMVLKSKGAPVNGGLILDIDSNYEVTFYKSFDGTYVYEFRKRGKNGKGND